ncbi:MAG: hypothetical protein K0B06_05035 [Brevefilum sp.]|nr:hypothetical protein [Brevefilum sp.]
MKKLSILILILVALILSGCQSEALTADSVTWLSEEPVLFMDDFTNQTGGWKTQEDRISFAGYTEQGFRLWVDVPNFLIWSVPGLNFKDARIYSNAQKIAGPDDNLFGVICRYQDRQNYYAFMISSDGYYGIYRRQAGIISRMGLTQMGFSEAIRRGDQANEILAVCQGDQLALFVNDTKLLQVTDDTFTHGDVGLIAGNLTKPGTDILFNYFIVLKP